MHGHTLWCPSALRIRRYRPFAAVLVKLDSSRRALFVQGRVGKGNRVIRTYKFRSMRQSVPGVTPGFASDHEHRITRFGRVIRKARLDELPQLLNVLRGEHEPYRASSGTATICPVV